MLKKRILLTLTLNDGVLFRTKKFNPDYRYTKNFVDLWHLDELILLDITKKNKLNKNFLENIKNFSKKFLVPITVGGGIKNLEDVEKVMEYGADKIIINTGLVQKPELINKISEKYGSQVLVASIDCKKINNEIKLMINNGKEDSFKDPIDWASYCIKNGVGELLINSVNNDGSLLGYDINLIKMFSSKFNVPILALGGAGNWQHIYDLFKLTNISGACTQNIYHFTNQSLQSLKSFLISKKIDVRI